MTPNCSYNLVQVLYILSLLFLWYSIYFLYFKEKQCLKLYLQNFWPSQSKEFAETFKTIADLYLIWFYVVSTFLEAYHRIMNDRFISNSYLQFLSGTFYNGKKRHLMNYFYNLIQFYGLTLCFFKKKSLKLSKNDIICKTKMTFKLLCLYLFTFPIC